jgi:peptidoglycan hydrolase-like protein with peptidoglycan-binding domain
VVVASAAVEEEPEVVVEVVEEKKVAAPTPAPAAPKGDKADPKLVPTVLTSDITVSRGKIVFESLYEHNSRSVGVLQIRLLELGYVAAGSDNRGYLSDGTLAAIKEFAGDHGLEANKIDNEQLMKAIFAGTPVTVGT